ncbi:Piso0_002736 [Millerozyma farinosa CBS 7064]|uniref:Piso0_002736 protein n=1 Tax=Pichia sorbitophila (strain ATCC MYA-4447 / BCRC 22081 / CBS 7064 / NBRC 10061 / NRRL Y-12695) TaxID=559304 RepID=G8YFU4_PICSO|nr:Piso0_002736 [Millerozyma farinosa CBS 7064]
MIRIHLNAQAFCKVGLGKSIRRIHCNRGLFQNLNKGPHTGYGSFNRADLRLQEKVRYKNRTAAYYAASLTVVFLALGFTAVPLYRALCQRTGWGGTPMTDSSKFTTDKVIPVDTNKRIRIQFTCQSSGILPWKFTPQQREVYVVPGETALAFYKAKNMSKDNIIGMATYSVTPEVAAPYFNKIQCFCFEEQRLNAGEEVDMPVFFFIDPDFAKDPQMRNVDDIVLNYSFFKASYTDGELAAVPVSEIYSDKGQKEEIAL